ncbi:MAG: hypothetical protein R3B97_07835 [Dehalococcoidia bacterium]
MGSLEYAGAVAVLTIGALLGWASFAHAENPYRVPVRRWLTTD